AALTLGRGLGRTKVADLARELDLVARNLAGVGDVDLVVLDFQRLDKSHSVALDLAVLELGITLLAVPLHAGLAGDVCAVLLEREGVFLQTALRLELGFPSACDVRGKGG